jgi:hypothetical protein
MKIKQCNDEGSLATSNKGMALEAKKFVAIYL